MMTACGRVTCGRWISNKLLLSGFRPLCLLALQCGAFRHNIVFLNSPRGRLRCCQSLACHYHWRRCCLALRPSPRTLRATRASLDFIDSISSCVDVSFSLVPVPVLGLLWPMKGSSSWGPSGACVSASRPSFRKDPVWPEVLLYLH